jgi:hypothetical protein
MNRLQQSSSLLGLIQNGAVVALLAVYLSLLLQHMLNDATRAAWALWLGDLHGCETDHLVTGFGNGAQDVSNTTG